MIPDDELKLDIATRQPYGEWLREHRLRLTDLVQEGREVRASLADCRWLDIGRQDDYAEAIATFDELRHEFLPEDLHEEDIATMEDLT